MKKKNIFKKAFAGIMAAALVMTSVAFTGKTAHADDDDVILQSTGDLTIHKYEFSGTGGTGTGAANDAVPGGAVGLNDVTFKVYKVANIVQANHTLRYQISDAVKAAINNTDNYIDANTDVTKFIDDTTKDAKTALNIASTDTKTVTTAGTGANKGTAKLTGLPIGLYLVVETDAPAKVTEKAAPFLVSIPSIKADGSDWNYDVNVFPKNSTSVTEVKLSKTDGTTPIAGSKFMLYKKVGTDWVRQTKDADNADFDSAVFNATSKEFTVPDTGLTLGKLAPGEYKFVESSAPKGFIADRKTEHTFKVVENDAKIYDSANNKITNNTIVVANEKPSIQKKVLKNGGTETNTADWDNVADYSTTKTVKFKVTVDIPKTIDDLKTFKIQDRFTAGQFDTVTFGSVKYYSGSTEVTPGTEITAANFTVDSEGTPAKQIGWTINLTAAQKTAFKTAEVSRIEIIYSSVLTKGAVTAGAGNMNDAALEYSHKTSTWSIPDSDKPSNPPSDETTEIDDKAFVYTFGLNIDKKFDGVDDTDRTGYMATFDVYVTDDSVSTTIPGTETTATKIGSYNTVDGVININTSLTGDNAYAFANGTYYLVETKTANGYNLLKEAVQVPINVTYTKTSYATKRITRVYKEDGTEDITKRVEDTLGTDATTTYSGNTTGSVVTGTDGATTITVVNKKGFTFPVTGGKGTILFTIVGLIIMAAAVVGFFASKKKKANA